MSNEHNTQAGANFLTNDQIAAGAVIECDHGAPIGRNVAIDVFDAMRAAAPVAAQAGQVAVPKHWQLVPKDLTDEMYAVVKEVAPSWNAASVWSNILDAAPSPAKESK